MIEAASKALDLDCSKSYVVGDRGKDLDLARRIGAKGILVLTGYGRGEWEYCQDQWKVKPDWVARDLYEAVQWILRQESPETSSPLRGEGRGEGEAENFH